MVRFKRGQTFDFAGQLTNGGVPYPLAGCTLYCDIRSRPYFAFVQHLVVTVLNEATALVQLYALASDTAKWQVMPHVIDIRLVDSTGETLISNTIEFDVLDTVSEAA